MEFLHPNKTTIMGILNVTPDSFSDGGKFLHIEKAVSQAKKMLADGADILDIGGESSRPGSDPVSAQQELDRVLPVIKELVKFVQVPISIDSYKPTVIRTCLEAGARIINDIGGLSDPLMREVAAEFEVPVIIMHMQGKPKTMQKNPTYVDVVQDICEFFQQQISLALESGIKKEQIVLDPGIGFGKIFEHNKKILQNIQVFKNLGYPVLIGASRKSFLATLGFENTEDRLEGTLAAHCFVAEQGVDIVRVHDVLEHKRALTVIDALHR